MTALLETTAVGGRMEHNVDLQRSSRSRLSEALRLTLLGVLVTAAPANASAASQTAGSEQETARTFSGTSAFTPQERRQVEAFLINRFQSRGISLDLVPLILKRVEAYATGQPGWKSLESYPKTTAYPSLALQIYWQRALEDIAAEFRSDFSVRRPPPSPHIIVLDLPRPLPGLNSVRWFAANAIEEAQGAFSREVQDRPLPSDLVPMSAPSVPRETVGRYVRPMRIARSHIAILDEAIPQVLADIRSAHPGMPIDEWTFPASSEAANFSIPARSGANAIFLAMRCAREGYCPELKHLAETPTPQPTVSSFKERLTYLDSLYLTNPFGHERAVTAVVRLDRQGAIASSFCGQGEIGYSPASAVKLAVMQLRDCIEDALGVES